MSSAALAQQAPRSVDTQQTERQLQQRELEFRRARKPPPKVPGLAPSQSRAGHRPLFLLTSVTVSGATVVAPNVIASAYAPYLRKKVSQSDLEAIANAITGLYRDRGYYLSRAIVPPQDVVGGHVQVKVIEGSIAEVRIEGGDAVRFGVKEHLDLLTAEHPARFGTVERQLLLANDTPGVRIADTALEEVGSATGRFRLIVKVETWHIYQSVGLDNYGSFAVGPLQAYSSTFFNSYLAKGDSLGLNLSTVPDATRDLRFGRLSYSVPIGTDGVRLGATVSRSEVWPDDDRRQIDTRTINQFYELRGSFVPLETRQSALTITAAVAAIDEVEKDALGTDYNDHIRIARISADYRLRDEFGGNNYFTAGLRQGLGGLGASSSDDPLTSRTGARPDFSVFEYSYTRYQVLSDAWSIKANIAGQFASEPLLSSQTFYLGGAAFGPGYYNADNGIAGLVELRFDQSVPSALITHYQLYAFSEGGEVWNLGEPMQQLVSVGAGVRLDFVNDFHAGMAVAFPVIYSSRTDEFRDARLLFSLSKSFKLCPERVRMQCL
ncbi:MAG TPA: POTRA domain-containing protein [Pseudolabrys sp.]|nr:POTRA domain-containing protein [Pseudolabrys sp.]